MTQKKEIRRTRFSNEVAFYIVGKKKFQNELLCSFLQKETGKDCYIFEDLRCLPIETKQPRMVIFDCHKSDMEVITNELEMYAARNSADNHIVLLNVSTRLRFEKKLLSQGIHGFFYDHDSIEIFLKGIKVVLNGRLWFPRGILSRYILNDMEDTEPEKRVVDKLSKREIEILSMVAVGVTNQEISKKLYISPHTVKNHLYSIFKKIRVSNRIQASLWAAVHL